MEVFFCFSKIESNLLILNFFVEDPPPSASQAQAVCSVPCERKKEEEKNCNNPHSSNFSLVSSLDETFSLEDLEDFTD